MANTAFIKHVPCPSCNSQDNGSLYADGSVKCHACGEKWQDDGSTPAEAPKPTGAAGLLEIDYEALPARKISRRTCEKFGYGISYRRGKKVQVATYYTAHGIPVAQKTRDASKSFSVVGDIGQAGLFGQHLWRPTGNKSLVICEGEIDALSVAEMQQCRWPVVSIPNGAGGAVKSIKAQLEWVESFDRVVLMFDQDEPGQRAAIEVAELLTPGKAAIARLDLKDPNELLKAGRGDEIIDAYWKAKAYRPDGILEGVDLWDMLRDRTPKPAVEYPFPELQAATRGWREAQLVVLCAGTSVGKSTVVKEIAYHTAMQGKRVGIVALEEQVRDSAEGLLGIHLNVPLRLEPDAVSVVDYRKAFDEVMPHFAFHDHFGSLDSDNLLAKIRYMVKGLGCDYIILDHISIVVSGDQGDDERKTIDRLMTKLASLAQESKAGIMAVSHLRKPQGREGKSFEEGRATTLADLRGSSAIAQLAFDVIGIERNLQGGSVRNTAGLRLLKCRETGATGPVGFLEYHEDTGRLLPSEAPTEDYSDFD